MNHKKSNDIDCIEMKRKAQMLIYEEIHDLNAQQQLEYFRNAVKSGAFKGWWEETGKNAEPETARNQP